MALILHPATGFPVGDPSVLPLDPATPPSDREIASALDPLILSASGWRKIFAAEGGEESLSAAVSPADLCLAACMARAFALRLAEVAPAGRSPAVALGLDSRPTGPALADIMIRIFLASGIAPRYAFIVAAPEIMAWTRAEGSGLSGFCYISASHNPPGHNGVKFGFSDGGVLPASEAEALAERFRSLVRDPAARRAVLEASASPEERTVSRVFSACAAEKRAAVSAYTLFARRTAADREALEDQERVLDDLAGACEARPIGVVAEMNGSARSLSIDGDFLSMLGVRSRLANARPRSFVHPIVPEGASLDPCRSELEAARAEDPAFVLGYVPDCDGDRGNLVRWDSAAGRAVALEAQEVFALAVLSELAVLGAAGTRTRSRIAVAVNDATSLRIDEIARTLGAEVFRAETGEANVVNLARTLRADGYVVRILGEGSNGGNITHPAAVRDPLNTVAALVKLLALRGSDKGPAPFRVWLEASGRGAEYTPEFTLDDVIRSLPAWTTTSVFEERALLRIPPLDPADMKRRYQARFLEEWPGRRAELERRFSIVSWEALASIGSAELDATGDFGAAGRGGLRILFRDGKDEAAGFLWMRGSGTEPVLRLMADLRGRNPEGEAWLLDWHREMVKESGAG